MRAARAALHPGDVHSTGATGLERQSMPRPTLEGLVCLQLTCASSDPSAWPQIIVRDPQLRSGCDLRVGPAAVASWIGTVAKERRYSTLAMPFARAGVLVHGRLWRATNRRCTRVSTSDHAIPWPPTAAFRRLPRVLLVWRVAATVSARGGRSRMYLPL